MCRKCHVFVMRSAKDLWGGEWTENPWQVKIRKCVDKEENSNWCVGSQLQHVLIIINSVYMCGKGNQGLNVLIHFYSCNNWNLVILI